MTSIQGLNLINISQNVVCSTRFLYYCYPKLQMENITKYIDKNRDRFLNEWVEFLKIPSISADSKYSKDVHSAASFVAEKLKAAGADNIEICATAGYPIVYGDKIIDKNLPTVLVYGHYDVQPPDPLELWESGPFEPVVKKTAIHPEGAMFARGACDDKGQMYMHVKAFEAMMQNNALACNVKFMFEGEEEVGSANLGIFVKANKERLKADVVLISDTSMIANDTPSIDVGLRGLAYMEVEVVGPNRDLHSGVYGGAVANPATILCQMIASMHDENNHITVPGFYNDVVTLTDAERKQMNEAPFSLDEYKKDLNIGDVWGEKGYTTLERTGIRPTLEVNGIWSGYIGEGAKTVLPSKAFGSLPKLKRYCSKVPKTLRKHCT
jgi:acetylornithine deacetylase/succinyl-diaminopimelate desuccinylase-like protein